MLRTKTDNKAIEVAVVYFRSGYLPTHYETSADWQIRLDIERSSAIKCPWIGAHLTGTKKVQQVLTESNLRNKFGVEQETRMKRTFAGMYSLDVNNPKIDQIKAWAMEYPEKFVLKVKKGSMPQREGGGNNIYGPALFETLKNTPPDELETFVLMERLDPFVHENILVRADQQLKVVKVDSELGVFGYVLGSRNGIVKQGNFGHIIRTKPSHFDEGGISTGKAAHDAPFLI
uniref:Glutathione synthetase n=1 Tax=Romanomermis culicivorax TaxID=13658 RepID=A0A915IXI3_ROMCU